MRKRRAPASLRVTARGVSALVLLVAAAVAASPASAGDRRSVGGSKRRRDSRDEDAPWDAAGSGARPSKAAVPCNLCERNWLFILAAHKTGSTSALTMLSSVPGFEMGGEHNGILLSEAKVYEKLAKAEKTGRFNAAFQGSQHRWDPHLTSCSVQDLLEGAILGADFVELTGRSHTAVLGFKEIRYSSLKMMRFIRDVFPCSRLIFTLREDAEADVHSPNPHLDHEAERAKWRR